MSVAHPSRAFPRGSFLHEFKRQTSVCARRATGICVLQQIGENCPIQCIMFTSGEGFEATKRERGQKLSYRAAVAGGETGESEVLRSIQRGGNAGIIEGWRDVGGDGEGEGGWFFHATR